MAKRPTSYALHREGGRHATWLELFFDLVFVLAIAELTHYLHVGGAVGHVVVTILIAALWVGVVVIGGVPNPLLTLVAVGAMYGVLAILLQQIIWNLILEGPRKEPLPRHPYW
ncbi:MAG TPA: low temperature requirement protein A [Rubrobacter sp.]|nr:low temperature requirement protein A [Rubrobacter sp.]